MKKKATLLIQHIEAIYTMIPSISTTVRHGFLAIHHEAILAIGEGEGWEFVDKDTRILEGRGHIVIPGMIDVSLPLPKDSCFRTDKASHEQDALRYTKENCEIMMKHGTLVGNLANPLMKQEERIIEAFTLPFEFDFLQQPLHKQYPIIAPLNQIPKHVPKRFCISMGLEKSNCLDQMLCAKLYHRYTDKDAQEVLAACTLYPALMLGLPRLGSIAKGKIANVLLMEGSCIEEVFRRLHGDEHMQVIKEGTRRYPNIII